MADEEKGEQNQNQQQEQKPQNGFADGYSSGKNEGFAEALRALGFASIDAAKAALAPQKPAEKKPEKGIIESEEYRSLASELVRVKEENESASREIEKSRKLADQARIEKFKSVARSKGVGEKQLDQFAKLFGDSVALSDDGEKLEVLSRMSDGKLVRIGKPVDEYVEKMANENPWFLGPKQPNGGGSGNQERPKENQNQNAIAFFDTRPLNERLKR